MLVFLFDTFRSDAKLMLSAANDGKIIAWGSSMLPTSVVKVSKPHCQINSFNLIWKIIDFDLISAAQV